jgi:hypothetical protein
MRESDGKSSINTKNEVKVKLKLTNVERGARQYYGFCEGVLACHMPGTMFVESK